MYGSETFATEVSSTSIKVASMMETAISHGFTLGFHSLGTGAAASALMLPPPHPADPQRRPNNYASREKYRDTYDREYRLGAITHGYRWDDRHPRAERSLHIRLFIK